MFNPLKGLGDIQKLQAQARSMQQALQQEEVTVDSGDVWTKSGQFNTRL